ncbi:hypothetical protein P3S67_020807 [Capsicum chacoense]
MLYKASSIANRSLNKMNTSDLVEVGARGSIGSLLRKEREYFRKLELECSGAFIESQKTNNYMKMDSCGCSCWHSLRSCMMKWKKKRRIDKCLTAMCFMVPEDIITKKGLVRFSNIEADLEQVLWF